MDEAGQQDQQATDEDVVEHERQESGRRLLEITKNAGKKRYRGTTNNISLACPNFYAN